VVRRGLAHKAGMSSARHDERAEDDAYITPSEARKLTEALVELAGWAER
jgi:hypothetical protein